MAAGGNDGARAPGERGATLTGALLSLYLAGDRQAERHLFLSQHAALLERAERHPRSAGLRRHAQPDELVAEFFVRALGSGRLPKFVDRESGALRRFLFGKLDDVINDMYRRIGAVKRGEGRPPVPLPVEEGGGGVPVVDTGLASREITPTSDLRVQEILELVRELLEPSDWEIWRRSELEGGTSVELARDLGLTDDAVRSRLHRARIKVLGALADRLGEPPRGGP